MPRAKNKPINTAKFADSLESLVSKIGNRLNERKYNRTITNTAELENAYNSAWIVRRYINKTIGDMTKSGREIYFSDDFDETAKNEFIKINTKLNTDGVIKDALFNLLLHGEVYILAVTDTAEQNYKTPISESETIKRFFILSANECRPQKSQNKFLDSDFYTAKMITIHKSRLIRLSQGFTSYGTKERKATSDINVALEICKMFDTVTLSVGDLVEECKLDIFRMDGFNDQIASGNEDIVLKRLNLIAQAKSYTNALAMDKTDKYETKETSLTGLADLWTKASIVVAGALGRPLSVIFGESASGLNSG